MTSLTEEIMDRTDDKVRSVNNSYDDTVEIRIASDRINIESLTEETIERTETQEPTETVKQTQIAKATRSQRLLQLAASQSGQTTIMLALLGLTLSIQFYSQPLLNQLWLIEAVIVIWLARSLVLATRKTNALGLERKLRTNLPELVREEVIIGIWFMTAAYLLNWSPSAFECLLFLFANLVAQGAAVIILRETVLNEPGRAFNFLTEKANSIIIAGTGIAAQRMADRIIEQSELGIEIRGFVDSKRTGLWRYRDIPLLGRPEDLKTIVADHQVDLLLITTEKHDNSQEQQLFDSAETMGLPIALLADTTHRKIARPQTNSFADLPIMLFHCAPQERISLALKSILDRTLAFVGLIMISPVMLLTAMLIKTESKGPVFFKQIRSGINGRPFKIYKFRTMCADAEEKKASLSEQNEMSGPVFKIKADPRITRLGKYLRKFSVDELPQLINVVKGEMSLVGPRPPLPIEVAGMEPWQRRKLAVLPGVTCTWQVSGRNAIDFEEWMRLDLDYIDNWSLWSDVKLIARTIPTVIKGSGT